jgi:hypothetical protein
MSVAFGNAALRNMELSCYLKNGSKKKDTHYKECGLESPPKDQHNRHDNSNAG